MPAGWAGGAQIAWFWSSPPSDRPPGAGRVGPSRSATFGIMQLETGDYPTATASLQRALALHREVGNQRGRAWARESLGRVQQLTGGYGDDVTGWTVRCRTCPLRFVRRSTDSRAPAGAEVIARPGGGSTQQTRPWAWFVIPASRAGWQALEVRHAERDGHRPVRKPGRALDEVEDHA